MRSVIPILFFCLIVSLSISSYASSINLKSLKLVDIKDKPAESPKPLFDMRAITASPNEKSILTVILNKENKGEYFIKVKSGDVFFSSTDLKKIGLKDIPNEAIKDQDGYVSVKSLYPKVNFVIDEKALAVILNVDPKLLEKHQINFSRPRPLNVIYSENNSAFLNYGIDYNINNNFDFSSVSIPLETGVRFGDYLFLSDFSYARTRDNENFTRLMSSITQDDVRTLRRYVLGDFIASSGTLGSVGAFGGLSISKNYSLSPYFVRFPGMEMSGVLRSSSQIEVYVDNALVKKESLSAGAFELFNLPVSAGAGNTKLVVKDAFGRVEEITTPFYTSSRLLKSGLHEYSYNLGFKRESMGEKSFEYSDLSFIGFHRFGFSDIFTGGLRAEADWNTANFGPSATFVLGKAGEVDTSFAVTDEKGQFGFGSTVEYFYSNRNFIGRLALNHYSKDYSDLSLSNAGADTGKRKFQGLAGLGFHDENFGSLTGTFSVTDYYNNTEKESIILSYSRLLFKNVSLLITASRTKAEEIAYEIFSGLSFTLAENTSANLNYQNRDGKSDVIAGINKNPPRGVGYGYQLNLDVRENEAEKIKGNGDGVFQYNTPYGIASAGYRRYFDQNTYDLKYSGSLSFINNSMYFSRPIYDSFALVKVGDVQGVNVKYSNDDIGVTGKNGEILVPELISYYDNQLSVEPQSIPIWYSFQEISKYISPPYRSGGIVDFGVSKIQSFEGRFYFEEKGQKVPVEYAKLELKTGSKNFESVTGVGGIFYFENLPAGTFPVTLLSGKKECLLDLVIPQTDKPYVNLGEFLCQ